MANPAALSKASKLAIGATSTVDQFLSFRTLNHGCGVELLDTQRDVATGSLAHFTSRIVDNRRRANPRFGLKPTVGEWNSVLPFITYVTSPDEDPTGTFLYAPGKFAREVERYVDVQDGGRYWHVTGAACTKWTLSAQSGAELLCDVECVGKDWTNTGSFPSGLEPDYKPPFIMANMAVQVGATSGVKVQDFNLSNDHMIDPDRFFNSATHAGPVNRDRSLSLTLTMPLGLQQALWDAGAGIAGVPVTLTFTGPNGSSLVVTMPAVRANRNPYDIRVPEETLFPWSAIPAASLDESDAYVPEYTIAYTPGTWT